MTKFTKIAGICFLTVGIAACGGGSGGGSSAGGNGSSSGGGNGGGNGGTPVASRTGEANYVGTFNATAKPQGNISSGGNAYKGGNFKGSVSAEADFDKDQIDLDLVAAPGTTVMSRYEAEFDDVAIKNGKFSGSGEEDIVANGGSLRSTNGRANVNGSFSADGKKISGTTASSGGLVNVETDFSASER